MAVPLLGDAFLPFGGGCGGIDGLSITLRWLGWWCGGCRSGPEVGRPDIVQECRLWIALLKLSQRIVLGGSQSRNRSSRIVG